MNRAPMMPRMLRPTAVTLVLLLLAGCADLGPIREYADISARSAAYTALVDDYAGFPERQKKYAPPAEDARLDGIAAERALQRDVLLRRHAVIADYLDALGQLASDQPIRHGGETSPAGNDADAASFMDIDRILFKAATDGWRRDQLEELIGESNSHFQTAVGALQKIVREGFGGDADDETVAARKYYDTVLRQATDPAGIAALEEWRETRLSEIDRRRQAIDAYADLLGKIAEGHQTLYDRRGDLAADDLLAQMRRDARDLALLLDRVRGYP
jgi:hypothetical protein